MKMGHQIILAISILSASSTTFAQATHYGDARRAELSSRRIALELKEPVARLGFLDTSYATRQQFMDNLEVGLTLPGFSRNNIISYRLVYMPKLGDEIQSGKIKGAHLPRAIFDSLNLSSLKTGDVVLFEDIRIENNDRIYAIAAPVRVVIL